MTAPPHALARTCALLLLLVLTVGLAAGCRSKKVVTCKANQGYDPKLGICYDCPAGTKADHKTASCVPVDDVDVPETELPVVVDLVEDDQGTEPPPPDSQPGDEVDSGGPPVDVVVPGAVGANCNKNGDCDEGFSCFDWPGGYCVQLDCAADEECPDGSRCVPLLENGQACFDGCETDADCRSGYGCKAIASPQGEAKLVCHPVGSDEKVLGAACTEHAQCVGSLSCIPMGPQSMCTRTGCSAFDGCPEGSTCIPWGAMTICLPECTDSGECVALSGSDTFTCQEMEDLYEADVDVCSPAQQGLAIGQLCFFSTECESGFCYLMVSGKCSGLDGSECATDADCKEGFCLANPSVQKGVCSQPCGPSELCPEGSLCGMTSEGAACLATCTSYGQPCGPEGFNMVCTYGTLYYPPAPSGKYACAKPRGGEAGWECEDAGDCESGICYGEEIGGGYCATACFTNNDCPFGTQCMQGALIPGEAYCTRVCFHDLDCPEGLLCKNTFFQEKACMK